MARWSPPRLPDAVVGAPRQQCCWLSPCSRRATLRRTPQVHGPATAWTSWRRTVSRPGAATTGSAHRHSRGRREGASRPLRRRNGAGDAARRPAGGVRQRGGRRQRPRSRHRCRVLRDPPRRAAPTPRPSTPGATWWARPSSPATTGRSSGWSTVGWCRSACRAGSSPATPWPSTTAATWPGRCDRRTLTPIGRPFGARSTARFATWRATPCPRLPFISAPGQIVGYAGTDRHPVVWDRCGAKMTALPQVPGASFVDLVSITARGDVLAQVQLGEAQGYARSSSAGTRAGRRASSARVPDGPRDHLCVACLQAARPSARSAASAAQPQPTVTPEPPCP